MVLQRRLGQVDAVSELAQRRLARNPNHLQSLAAQAWVYEQTGKSGLQQQVCRDILERSEQLPVYEQAPALVEAQAALQVA
ncbi:hypothetical protein [Candidatus Entotheonella palauensis]|nr:hypothetical protein [Candidatus Entotheonella palauensis]